MKISVEVSLYPLADGYLDIIKATVERLSEAEEIAVKTNSMSTQLTGKFESIMKVLQSEILQTFQNTDKAVFVCKFLNSAIEL